MKMKQYSVLAIVDILFPPKRSDAGRALLGAVHEIAVQSKVEISACLLNSHSPISPIFKKCGYFKTPEIFSLFIHEPKGTTHPFSEDTFNRWHLTWFDNDAV
jgi:hypothetical protein